MGFYGICHLISKFTKSLILDTKSFSRLIRYDAKKVVHQIDEAFSEENGYFCNFLGPKKRAKSVTMCAIKFYHLRPLIVPNNWYYNHFL